VSEEPRNPEWCIVANLLPYPYSPNGPNAHFRSQKIFPAGAKLYVVGGFAGMGHETVTVIGYGHRRRRPVTAHIMAKYLGGWRAELVYRPAILRAIHTAAAREDLAAHRWRSPPPDAVARTTECGVSERGYGEHLAEVAAGDQRRSHGSA